MLSIYIFSRKINYCILTALEWKLYDLNCFIANHLYCFRSFSFNDLSNLFLLGSFEIIEMAKMTLLQNGCPKVLQTVNYALWIKAIRFRFRLSVCIRLNK